MGSQPHPNPEFLCNRLSTPEIRNILAISSHGNEAISTLFYLPVVPSPLREAMRSSRPISAVTQVRWHSSVGTTFQRHPLCCQGGGHHHFLHLHLAALTGHLSHWAWGWVWWPVTFILAFGSRRSWIAEFEASLITLAWSGFRDPCPKWGIMLLFPGRFGPLRYRDSCTDT